MSIAPVGLVASDFIGFESLDYEPVPGGSPEGTLESVVNQPGRGHRGDLRAREVNREGSGAFDFGVLGLRCGGYRDAPAGRCQAASASILAAILRRRGGRIRRVRAESAPTRGPSGRRWARVRAGMRRATSGTVTAVARGAAAAVSGALGAAPPAGWRPTRFPVHRRAPGMAPGRAGNARRRPLMGEGGRQAQRRRAPHPHRRPVDAPGRPPSPPGRANREHGAATAPAMRSGADLGDSPSVTNRDRAPRQVLNKTQHFGAGGSVSFLKSRGR